MYIALLGRHTKTKRHLAITSDAPQFHGNKRMLMDEPKVAKKVRRIENSLLEDEESASEALADAAGSSEGDDASSIVSDDGKPAKKPKIQKEK